MFEEVPIDKITIGPRFRQDLGDIPALAASIEAIGLLHPIIVTTEYELVAGGRRVAAHEHLGRTTIEARVIDLDDPMAAEVDENAQRKPYVISEWVAIGRARRGRDKKNAEDRMREGAKQGGRGKKKPPVNITEGLEVGPARDVTAKAAGMSWLTFERAEKVVRAAEEEPELQYLVERMDRTGNVIQAFNDLPLYSQQDEEDAGEESPPPKVRHLSYDVVMQRVDSCFQKTVIPQLRFLTTEEYTKLRALFAFHVEYLDKYKDHADAHSA